MKNQGQTLTDDEIAKNEPPVKADEIIAEIEPLLKDYFNGEISIDGQYLTYRLPNGQKFKLSVEEVA